jgi:hypothetical protein
MKSLKIITIALLIVSQNSFSQEEDKRFCFEPIFGMFIPKHKFNTTPNINLVNKENYGYKFGFLKNVGIGQMLVIRPAVSLSVFKRESYITNYTDNSSPILFNNSIEGHTQASLHISQNFTTGRARTFLYLIQGATFDYNLTNVDESVDLWIEDNQNITLDLGIGTRFYANRKHLFAIEILYSYGLRNLKEIGVNVNSPNISVTEARNYGNNINDIRLHYITLQFLL